MAALKPDVLYVKLKKDSPFTVSRARIDRMAEYFQQDTTFITHFALARLSEDISQGKLASADVPIASQFLSSSEVNGLRAHIEKNHGMPELVWQPNPMLDSLLGR